MSAPSRQYCSVHSKSAGIDPGGTAWAAGRFLIPELRLPWPSSPLDARSVPPEVPKALETIWREGIDVGVFAIAPDRAYSTEGITRIMSFDFSRPNGGQANRIDYLVPDALVAQCLLLLARDQALPSEVGIDDTQYRDFMICTHGSRDTCCATFGFPLYRGLRTRFGQEPMVRVWRATHFGGHAFAPTMMTFPDGRSWAHLDDELAAAVVLKDGTVERLRAHYRGWCGYEDRALQLLEREAFAHEGWQWLGYRQTGQVAPSENDGGQTHAKIVAESPEGEVIEFSGIVERRDEVLAISSCGYGTSAIPRDEVTHFSRRVLQNVGGVVISAAAR